MAEALQRKILVITGGPGVGKTTVVRVILDILEAKGVAVSLAAPTGRAAKRLQEAMVAESQSSAAMRGLLRHRVALIEQLNELGQAISAGGDQTARI